MARSGVAFRTFSAWQLRLAAAVGGGGGGVGDSVVWCLDRVSVRFSKRCFSFQKKYFSTLLFTLKQSDVVEFRFCFLHS